MITLKPFAFDERGQTKGKYTVFGCKKAQKLG